MSYLSIARWKRKDNRNLVKPYFDIDWYCSQHTRVPKNLDACVNHYLKKGRHLLSSPHPLFDGKWYYEANEDVKKDGMDPLVHYILHGSEEGRLPHPLFDPHFYTTSLSPADKLTEEPLLNYIKHHMHTNISPHPLFDPVFFNSQTPRHKYSCHLIDYLTISENYNLNPSKFFDGKWYLSRYKDIKEANINPLVHFLKWGWKEDRLPTATFNAGYIASQIKTKTVPRHPVIDLAAGNIKENAVLEPANVDVYRAESSYKDISIPPSERVAVGVVLYNETPSQIEKILSSTKATMSAIQNPVDVYVFDNGGVISTDTIPEWVKFIPSGKDQGFGIGHNSIMRRAFADGNNVYIGANPDGAFHRDCLSNLLKMNIANNGRALIEAIQFPDEHPKFFHPETLETDWISCACFLVSRHIWDATSGFDENIYLYCEDVDLSWSARHKGFKTLVCPTALFYHDVSARGFDLWRYGEMLTSARYLAHKWKSHGFRLWAEQQLLDLNLAAHIAELPDIDSLPSINEPGDIPDFSRHFHFSGARW